MKLRHLFSGLVFVLFYDCRQAGLSRAQAFSIIKKANGFPKSQDYKIYAGDADEAKGLLHSSLVTDGFIQVLSSKGLSEHKPWVVFTPKSTPYLLPTNDKEKQYFIQRIKTAEVDMDQIMGIKMDYDDMTAEVDYTVSFTKITPFGKWLKLDSNANRPHSAVLRKYDDDWHLQK